MNLSPSLVAIEGQSEEEVRAPTCDVFAGRRTKQGTTVRARKKEIWFLKAKQTLEVLY
jgi:hypothetical protein